MYDIIGDIHGQAGELDALLNKLGYNFQDGAYRHPSRKVIYLGDFIDRGDRERDVINIVRPMVEQGHALAVMGNHEFNAIAYHTLDPSDDSKYLRPRNNKNALQHAAFLAEYEGSADEWRDVIEWFKTLPLWLELDGLRVIHACWHEPSVTALRGLLTAENCLTDQVLINASREGCVEYDAVETLLKGLEVELPENRSFSDKDGNIRTAIRTRWWLTDSANYSDVAMGPPSMMEQLPDEAFDMSLLPGYPVDADPVFVGHYWMDGEPDFLSSNVVCTDYSVAKDGGKLVAYRWNVDQPLHQNNFISVDRVN